MGRAGRRRYSRADAPECPVVDPVCGHGCASAAGNLSGTGASRIAAARFLSSDIVALASRLDRDLRSG